MAKSEMMAFRLDSDLFTIFACLGIETTILCKTMTEFCIFLSGEAQKTCYLDSKTQFHFKPDACLNKPKIRGNKQFDALHRAIETSVENFDFNQADSYAVELTIDHDSRVELSHIEFECHADLYEQIIYDVEKLFGVADESDDDNELPSE